MAEPKLTSELKGDIEAAKKLRMPWWGVLCGIVGSFLTAWLFDTFGKLEFVLPTLNTIAVLCFMLYLKRKLWPETWFRIIMILIAALHVAVIWLIPWTTTWVPAFAIAAIDSLDLIWILILVSFIEKRMKTNKAMR